jgi:hypothetical protein
VRSLLIAIALACAVQPAEATSRFADAKLRALVLRVRAAAVARDVQALARLVDRDFTTGEEQSRANSLEELRQSPQLLQDLVVVIDARNCRVKPALVQCEAHPRNAPPGRRAMVIFTRDRGRWSLAMFSPVSDSIP